MNMESILLKDMQESSALDKQANFSLDIEKALDELCEG